LKKNEQTLPEKPRNIWGFRRSNFLQISLTFRNQTLLNFFWADSAENFSIAIRFLFFNNDHDRDQNTDPDRSDPAENFSIAITIAMKKVIWIDQGLVSCTRSEKSDNPAFHRVLGSRDG